MFSGKVFKKSISFVLILLFTILCIFPASAAGDVDISSTFDDVEAKAAFVVDHTTGEILYSYNADKPLPPASTTKIITTLLVLEAVERGEISLDDKVLVTNYAVSALYPNASRMQIPLVAGEYLSLLDLLYANMVSSDCFASNVLGEYLCGNLSDFVDLMNSRAEELGCEDTHFANPSGYPSSPMYATARSLYIITAECLKYDTFREIVSASEYVIPATNLKKERTLINTNMLLSMYLEVTEDEPEPNEYYYEYATGIKTGHTSEAGYCLVSSAEKDGHEIVAVVLGCKSIHYQFSETIRIFDHYFNFIAERTEKERIEREERERQERLQLCKSKFDARKSIVLENSDSAEIIRGKVMEEDEAVRLAFEEKRQAELNNRLQIISIASLVCILLILILTATLCIRKVVKRKKLVHK
ncbi:MAG: D-alanyl-D-alanine carboxypeptidase [Oscillospiraceae bacterium]|nr:D-alanyl-D-alanine carboxypeptidase [Oscillospiraceae bacterium]